ncbi:hypothetical protein ACOBR2_13295 [Telmatobacter bradus]|uniref:hypothetical protein n=1 Tax=Telmatobacter bradus TaxID=474953 RepID=UPI003B43BFD9
MPNEIKDASRRGFLVGAPAAAVAGLALADALNAVPARAEDAVAPYQLFTAETIAADLKALTATPGNTNLFVNKGALSMLTVEGAKSAKEYEWHELRDHIFLILDGETTYEVGGTPKGGHKIREHEWLAPEVEGTKTLTLKKGDLLSIPRGVLHKRTTKSNVTFLLITSIDSGK